MIKESININIILDNEGYKYSMIDAKDCINISKTEEYKSNSKKDVMTAVWHYIDNNLKEKTK